MEGTMFWRTLLQLLMISAFAACGAENKSTSARKKVTLTPEIMDAVLARQNLTCPEGDCPEAIGRFFAINYDDAEESSMCTGFLVAPDMVMTNSHCVYAGEISQERTCEGLYFSFLSGHGITEQARCSEIVWRDPKQRGNGYFRKGEQDFALVKLDQRLSIMPLELDRAGLRNQTKVFPVVVDHIDLINARIVKLNCHAYGLGSEGYARMGNCPAISGNSGSPVLDVASRVVGILFCLRKPQR